MSLDLPRILFLAGALPFLLLGAAHALYTPVRPEEENGLSPRDPAVARAMAGTTPRLTARTDLWKAWVGFNYSHSLGAIIFGLFVLLIGWDAGAFATYARTAIPLAIVIATTYLVLGIKYWFRTPIIGTAVSVACFALAWILR